MIEPPPLPGEWPELARFRSELDQFIQAREWQQFHSPKNLAMALAGEVGELLEHFQWLSEAQSRKLTDDQLEAVAMELADIQIYLANLSGQLGIALGPAVQRKMAINAKKYPVEASRGRATKYTKLDCD
ncbi:MAG: nucleotide pyrophosphohydrolase [Wenzhouxiangella sp.]